MHTIVIVVIAVIVITVIALSTKKNDQSNARKRLQVGFITCLHSTIEYAILLVNQSPQRQKGSYYE